MDLYADEVFETKAPDAKFSEDAIDDSFKFNEARQPQEVAIETDEYESDDVESEPLSLSERLAKLKGGAPKLSEDEVIPDANMETETQVEDSLSERLRKLQGI